MKGKLIKKKIKNKKRRTEFISLSKVRTARKYSLTMTRKKEERQQALKAK